MKKRNATFLRCHFYIKCIIIPRQARDKHRETTPKKEWRRFCRIRACILHGCDLEATDECGQTAAFLAAWRGRVAALQLLTWAGAAAAGAGEKTVSSFHFLY
eukprot:COSAG06_NODE_8872_length_2044_cov_2.738303_3_plen_102_part_00